MNKYFFLFFAFCLISCGTSKTVTPLSVSATPSVQQGANDMELEPVKVKLKIQDKAVTLLNQLFNTDESNKHMVLIINNESDCDFTMNILGGKSYTVPVAAKKTESIVVEQGDYVMRSEVCKSPYLARKTLSENTQVSIKYSVVKKQDDSNLAVIQ